MDIVSRLPPRVPKDLIIEIFLRLPAKSLLRFKSACREWQKIIENPSFERDHVHLGGEFTSHLVYWYGDLCNHGLDFENECDFEIDEEIALERYEVPGLNDITSMHGPCYGIICVEHFDNTLALWNPTTKRLRLLPTCPLVTSNSRIGFGLDPVTDDLKIVLFDARLNKRQYAIYNSRNGAWNLLESNVIFYPGSYVSSSYAGCSVLNGVCYWVILDIRAQTSRLLAFDMRSDLFQDIELPEILHHCCSWGSTLDIFEDNLALLANSYDGCDNTSVEIWLMKEQGCWTKHSIVVLDFHSTGHTVYDVKCWKRNQIIVWTYDKEMIIYDLDSGKTRNIELGRIKDSCTLCTFPCRYKESLISV